MDPRTSYAAVVGALLLVAVAADAASPPGGSATKAPPASPSSSSGKYSVEEVCKHTAGHYGLCVETLLSDPSSREAAASTAAELARVAILAAQQNASQTATFLSSIYDDSSMENMTAQLQQCLEDCGERYELAVQQLTDATTAVDTGAYNESEALVVASQAEVKLCQRGCQAVPEHRNILTTRNRGVDQLCSIALTITKLIRNGDRPVQ